MKSKGLFITKGELFSTIALLFYFGIALMQKEKYPQLIHWLGLLIFIYSVYTWVKKRKDNIFNPYSIFQLFFLLFNYGQPLMWALGIHKKEELGIGVLYYGSGFYPNSEDMLNAQIYTCLAMLIFHFGAVSFIRRMDNTQDDAEMVIYNSNNRIDSIKNAMKKTSFILLIIISPIAISNKIGEVIIARNFGYKSLYYGEHSTQNGYMQILMYFFFPALVGYLISTDYAKNARKIVYFVFGLYAFLGVLSGDRGSWLYSLVILIWLHTHYIKIPIRKYVIIVLFSILGIYLLSAITNVRNTGLSLTLTDIISVFNAENSPITDSIFEMGGSMGLIVFFLNRGNEIFPYSNTYLTAILGAVSSRFLGLFDIKQVLIANWFSQDYLGITWGTGFSMIAEAYVNGGYIGGLIYMYIWGVLHGKLFEMTNDRYFKVSPMRMFVTTAGLNVILGFIRGSLYLTLKEMFYGVFILSLIIIFLAKYEIKKLRESYDLDTHLKK